MSSESTLYGLVGPVKMLIIAPIKNVNKQPIAEYQR